MTNKVCSSGDWTNSCKILDLRRNGFYGCKKCGLVFSRLSLSQESPNKSGGCNCRRVILTVRWVYDDFFDYSCPVCEYKCEQCQRVYSSPHYQWLAPLEAQRSAVAKAHVLRLRKYQLKKIREAQEIARMDLQTLKRDLEKLPEKDRKELLKELFG